LRNRLDDIEVARILLCEMDRVITGPNSVIHMLEERRGQLIDRRAV
jgi:hypothetical protein